MTWAYELALGIFPYYLYQSSPYLYYNSLAHLQFVMNGRNRSEESSKLSKTTQLVGRWKNQNQHPYLPRANMPSKACRAESQGA